MHGTMNIKRLKFFFCFTRFILDLSKNRLFCWRWKNCCDRTWRTHSW